MQTNQYEIKNILVNCPSEITEQEATLYLDEQLKLNNHENLVELELELSGDEVLLKPHYNTVNRVRRITGYLSSLTNFNDAKKSEATDRVTHF